MGPIYRLRFFFDAGSGACLWSGSDAANERFGYNVDHHALPLPGETATLLDDLLDRYDASFPWDDPASGEPRWSDADEQRFRADVAAAIAQVRRELGGDFDVVDESRLNPPEG